MTKNYPPFSVLMSVYKNEKPSYLDKALESIENQSVRPSEIVLVEDGPISAELKNVILKHQNRIGKTFKDISSKKNQGLGASLRLGTNYVSTNWIARMDSDDISVANRFELQLEEIIKQPNLAVVGGQVKEFAGNEGNIVGSRRVPTTYNEIKKFMKLRSPFNHPTVMINKEKLNKIGGYIPYGNLEDYYLWSRIISKNYLVCNLNEALVYMRVDDGMYKRRGKLSNIVFLYKLRRYMNKNYIISTKEEYIGDFLMTLIIIVPNCLRKIIYTNFLHRKNK